MDGGGDVGSVPGAAGALAAWLDTRGPYCTLRSMAEEGERRRAAKRARGGCADGAKPLKTVAGAWPRTGGVCRGRVAIAVRANLS